MRPWLAWSSLVLAAAAARPAAAEKVLNDGKVKVELFLPKAGSERSDDEDDYEVRGDLDVTRYFNGARCTCDRTSVAADSDKRQMFLLKLTFDPDPTPVLSTPVPLAVFAGDMCGTADENMQRRTRCSTLAQYGDARALVGDLGNVFARSGDLLAPGDNGTGTPNPCGSKSESGIVVVANAETTTPLDATNPAVKVVFDLKAPLMPDELGAIGLEQSITVSWDPDEIDLDTKYFQALCATASGAPAHPSTAGDGTGAPTSPARFDTTDEMCAVPITPVNPATLTDGSGPDGMLPASLAQLDKTFVCGEATDNASSITLKDLVNGEPYWVVVLAIDTAGNYDARYIPHTVSPVPSIDFWEDLNAENPDVDGGFCVSQVGRGGSAASGLLVLAAVAIAVRRRRRRSARNGARPLLGLLGLIAVAPASARAQSWDPYWIDSEAEATTRDEVSKWHVGVRVGPYHPAIDEKFDTEPGPFRRMFGPGYNLVPQLDLHRLWQLSALQVGVGMSGGYYAKSADAYQIDTLPTDPDRPRSAGATNTFKMIPLSVTGVARLTTFDDRWGVPLVPYVRGGVAYNVWWVRNATGELAMTSCDTCKDKALGGSAGLVGAVGLSIRGERIDPEASHSMKNGGVEHAGFYVELETSWVDSFGNERRLSLGDTTWYAGVDFEF